MEKKIPVSALELGMYVSSLDRPWLETPYLVQGIQLKSSKDILDLSQYCQYVYIDTERSQTGSYIRRSARKENSDDSEITGKNYRRKHGLLESENQDTKSSARANSRRTRKFLEAKPRDPKAITRLFPHRTLRSYHDAHSADEELTQANIAIEDLKVTIKDVFDSYSGGTAINVSSIRNVVEPMVNSIIRNPDASIWLTRLRNVGDYNYQHAVSSSVWAVALGRHIGLPKNDLQNLAIGVTLLDIGKTLLPKEIVEREEKLSEEEFELLRTHVTLGADELRNNGGVNNNIIDIVLNHHERADGGGYPNKLRGDDIPVLARMAAIADCYDAITTERPNAKAVSPSEAVRKLYDWRDEAFQTELVEEFIQAIGIYPAGTVVELSNGEVGVVYSEYRSRRLRPKIMQLLDSDKHPLPTVKIIDLLTTTHDSNGEKLEIVASLEPNAYGLDLESLNI